MKNLFMLLSLSVSLLGCKDDELPPLENPEELIDKIELIFSPVGGGAPVTVQATADQSGEIKADESIILNAETEYELFIKFENTITGESISEEVESEGDEHMIFFEFTSGIFSSPSGDGNVDNREDAMNYLDKDVNDLPIGLITAWQTGTGGDGFFRILLKHQPDVKTATSGSEIGETDVDFTWNITVD